jgi:hypothetical protein
MSAINARVKEIIANELGVEIEKVTDEASFVDDPRSRMRMPSGCRRSVTRSSTWKESRTDPMPIALRSNPAGDG